MRDLVPESEFGRFFGRRAAATTAVATALALVCGLLIDAWKRTVPEHILLAYSAVFIVSAALGLFGVWLLSITPEQPMPPIAQRTRILGLLAAPFRDPNFRRLMVFLSSWNFAANLAAPFFAVYMLKTLGYSMTMVIVLTTASQLSNLAALGLWGSLIDRFSNRAVLEISAPLFLICTLAWTFTGIAWMQPVTLYLLFAIHVLMGIATAGVALASGNIAMKLSPAGQATGFLAASSVVSASCAAIAPVIGGLCADFFAAHSSHSHSPGRAASSRSPFRCSTSNRGHSCSGWRLSSGYIRCIVFHSSGNSGHRQPIAGARSAAGGAPVDPQPVERRWPAPRGAACRPGWWRRDRGCSNQVLIAGRSRVCGLALPGDDAASRSCRLGWSTPRGPQRNGYQRQAEAVLDKTKDVESYFSVVNIGDGVSRGMIFTNLVDFKARTRSMNDIIGGVQGQFFAIPGVFAFANNPPAFGFGSPVQFVIQHPDFALLRRPTTPCSPAPGR